MSGQGKGYEMVLPTRVSPQQFSEVDDELVRMGSPIGMPSRKLSGVDLDANQYNGMDNLSLEGRQKQVQQTHSKLMTAAQEILKSRDLDLQEKIREFETNREVQGLYYK